MKGMIMRILLLCTFIVLFQISNLFCFSGNGSGTVEDPYQITNVQELQEMELDLAAHYKLIQDIDASETGNWNIGDADKDPETEDVPMGFAPIGQGDAEDMNMEYKASFRGVFDGAGHRISNLYINRPQQIKTGLFGGIYDTLGIVRVCNLELIDCSINGLFHSGGLCGHSRGKSGSEYPKFNNIKVSGVINASNRCGGLIGYRTYGTIDSCSSYCDITSNSNVGGLIGFSVGSITNCICDCQIKSRELTGGITGYHIGDMTNCSSSGSISSASQKADYINRFIGGVSAVVRSSVFNNVSSTVNIDLKNGDEDLCAGGIIGSADDLTITNCNYTGMINAFSGIGGLVCVCLEHVYIYNCNVEADINGYDLLGGIIGDCRSGRIVDCTFSGIITGHNDIGGIVGNHNSEDSDTLVIDNCISECYIEGHESIGGIAGSAGRGIIYDSHSGGKIDGYMYVGGITGSSVCTIELCYSLMDMQTVYEAGGICASNGGEISRCSFHGSLSSSQWSAGIAYYSGGFIHDCYISPIEGRGPKAALVAWAQEELTVRNCYNYIMSTNILHPFAAPIVENCFYKLSGSAGKWDTLSIGLSAEDMLLQSTYEAAGWNFDSVWTITPGLNRGYPHLQKIDYVSVEESPEPEPDKLIIFPNPASDIIYLKQSHELIDESGQYIRIYNVNGEQLIVQRIGPADMPAINISSLPSGVYIIRFGSGSEMFTVMR